MVTYLSCFLPADFHLTEEPHVSAAAQKNWKDNMRGASGIILANVITFGKANFQMKHNTSIEKGLTSGIYHRFATLNAKPNNKFSTPINFTNDIPHKYPTVESCRT